MNSKDIILNSLRSVCADPFPKPDISFLESSAVKYEDKFSQFCIAVKAAGGDVVELDGCPLDEMMKKLYPDAVRIASAVKGCTGFNPDEAHTPGELDGTDVAVVTGEFGVAENGALWISQVFKHRAVLFISDALVIVMDRENIVNNMHEAYLRLGEVPSGYGIFISGPSKTADIEQALVLGAHGARSLTILVK